MDLTPQNILELTHQGVAPDLGWSLISAVVLFFQSFHLLQVIVYPTRWKCRMYCLECKKGKGSPYSITEHRVPELIPVVGSQPAGDVGHKPSGRLPLLFARPSVTLTGSQPLRGLLPVSLLGE